MKHIIPFLLLFPVWADAQVDSLPAADAGITYIDPPQAQHQGGAALEYPLRLPPGRQGMQPELTISYDSEAEESWLGLGWNLVLPTIEIDTRWGIPRFDPEKETETYLYQGEQLYPVAHRGALRDRQPERSFFPRVEGTFDRIIRHGDHPSAYWWEVTATDGTRFFYGRSPDDPDLSAATLVNDEGAIVRWALRQVRDRNGNRIDYSYRQITHSGGPAGGGQQLYPGEITYTNYEGEPGPFRILFLLDRDLDGQSTRPDVTINGRLGLKEVTGERLRRIEIMNQGQVIRAYRLDYTTGVFAKSLLTAITEEGRDGTDFYTHEFDYYDDRANGMFGEPQTWQAAYDNIRVDFAGFNVPYTGETSIIGGSFSDNFSVGGAATAGPNDWQLFSKNNTYGGTYARSESKDEGQVALVDLNGDGRPDKLFRRADQLYYRPNLGIDANGRGAFGDAYRIEGISRFSRSETKANSVGVELNPPPNLYGGSEVTFADSYTYTYFSDVNGDGLLDIIDDAVVYFNHLNEEGHPVFTKSSLDTPSPIQEDAGPAPGSFEEDPAELEARIDQHPLQDVVRMWQAPFAGTVRIDAPVRLLEPTDPAAADYFRQDGVRVAVQVGQDERWAQRINPGDVQIYQPAGLNQVAVEAGDRIYFRVQSVFDGAYDRVDWQPTIEYTNLGVPDNSPEGLSWSTYSAAADFAIFSDQRIGLPLHGEVTIQGPFSKQILSDSVRAVIRLLRDDAAQMILDTVLAGKQIVADNWSFQLSAQPGDELSFRLITQTQIDWTGVSWLPDVYYVSSPDMAVTGPDGAPLFRFCPSVAATMYNHIWRRSPPVVIPSDGRYGMILDTEWGQRPEDLDSLAFWGVHAADTLCVGAEVSSDSVRSDTLWIEGLTAGDTLFPTLYIREYAIAEVLAADGIRFWAENSTDTLRLTPGLQSGIPEEQTRFGHLYRGWGQFIYNGNRERAEQPMVEELMQLDSTLTNPVTEPPEDPENVEGGFKPEEADFLFMLADAKNRRWIGMDSLTFITALGHSTSRLGATDILPFAPDPQGAGVTRIIRESKTREISGALGGGIGPVSGTGSYTNTNTRILSDLIDLNGDRFPDIIRKKGDRIEVQYSNTRGGLDPEMVPLDYEHFHQAKSNAIGFTLGGSFVSSRTSNTGEPKGGGSNRRASKAKRRSAKSGRNAKNAGNTADDGVGISGNFSKDWDYADNSFQDINGDGLPDKSFTGGRVDLNLGKNFSATTTWPVDTMHKGSSLDFGAGLGFTLFNGSIAGGQSFTSTEYASTLSLDDVNNDGKPDILIMGDPIRVRYNTGAGFTEPLPWASLSSWDKGSATGQSGNAAITICAPILLVKLCFNPSGSTGGGISRQLIQLEDMDGDGYLDWVESENDGDLTVRLSKIGRTNKLRRVTRPMGGSFVLDYSSSVASYDLPYTIWLLTRVEAFDGVPEDGDRRTLLTYRYQDPRFDRHERAFLGYGRVITESRNTSGRDSIYRQVVRRYDNRNYYRKGLLLSEEWQRADGQPLRAIRYSYQVRSVEEEGNLSPVAELRADYLGFPLLSERQFIQYDESGRIGLTRRTTYTYDRYGQIIRVEDFGGGHPAEWMAMSLSYHHDVEAYDVAQWSELVVEDQNGILRKRTAQTDDRGNVIAVREYRSNDQFVTYSFTRDMYGNVLDLIRPPNHEGAQLSFTWTYDSLLHHYPVRQEDSYGYTVEAEYDIGFGQRIAYTDENQQSFLRKLDAYGRLAETLNPLDAEMGADFSEQYAYEIHAETPYVQYRRYDPAREEVWTRYQFQDGYGRLLQTQSPSRFAETPDSEPRTGTQLSGRLFYDAFDRVTDQHYPRGVFQQPTGSFVPDPEPVAPYTIVWDEQDRPVRIQGPDSAVWTITYEYGSSRAGIPVQITNVRNPLGQEREMAQDVRGRILRETQGGQSVYYQYDVLGQLRERTDGLGLSETRDYDWQGQLIAVDHPALGLRRQEYDPAGNMVRQITPALAESEEAIRYVYDYERLQRIEYPFHPEQQVRYHYGNADADNNRVGRVMLIEDGTGARELGYNALGEINREVRTILINDIRFLTLVTTWQYDSWGRLLSMTFPDGEHLTYRYDEGGEVMGLSGVKGDHNYVYLEEGQYHSRGQLQRMILGNTVHHELDVNPLTNRYRSLSLENASQTMLTEHYEYDALQQVRAMRTSGGIGAEDRFVANFAFDDLNRLVGSTFMADQKEAKKEEEWLGTYDNGNRLALQQLFEIEQRGDQSDTTQQQWLYDYAGHLPERINDDHLDINPNGAWESIARGDQAQEMVWDDANRLLLVADNGLVTRYGYDDRGVRVIESVLEGDGLFVDALPLGLVNHSQEQYRLYVNPYITLHQDGFVKHYFLADQRLASKQGSGYFVERLIDKNQQVTAGNLDFSERVQLLRATMLSFLEGLGFPPGHPTMPGSGGDAEGMLPPQPDYGDNPLRQPAPGWPAPQGQPDPTGPPGHPVWFAEPADSDNAQPGYGYEDPLNTRETDLWFYHFDPFGQIRWVSNAAGAIQEQRHYRPLGSLTHQDLSGDAAGVRHGFMGLRQHESTGWLYLGEQDYDPEWGLRVYPQEGEGLRYAPYQALERHPYSGEREAFWLDFVRDLSALPGAGRPVFAARSGLNQIPGIDANLTAGPGAKGFVAGASAKKKKAKQSTIDPDDPKAPAGGADQVAQPQNTGNNNRGLVGNTKIRAFLQQVRKRAKPKTSPKTADVSVKLAQKKAKNRQFEIKPGDWSGIDIPGNRAFTFRPDGTTASPRQRGHRRSNGFRVRFRLPKH